MFISKVRRWRFSLMILSLFIALLVLAGGVGLRATCHAYH
jgi:hypothetical protein